MALNTNGPNLSVLVNADDGDVYGDEGRRAMRAYDFLIQARVIDRAINVPPSGPADGAGYIVGSAPTGAWVGRALNLARWSALISAWEFFVPKDGWQVKVTSVDKRYEFSTATASWFEVSSGSGGSSLATVVPITDSAYDVLASDSNAYLRFTATGAKTCTFRPQSTHALPANGEWHIRNSAGAGNLTLVPGSAVTLNAPYGGTLSVPPGGTVTVKRISSNLFDVMGVTA